MTSRIGGAAAAVVLLAVAFGACRAPRTAAAPGLDEALRRELLALHAERVRCFEAHPDAEWPPCGDAVDEANARRLEVIVQQRGWPTRAMVGDDGANAAFLVLQHAPRELVGLQQACLPLLQAAWQRGEVSGQDLALLTDRVLVRLGQPQRFGSQFHRTDAGVVPYPIEDEASVDERRRQMGLGTFDAYRRGFEPAQAADAGR